MTLSGLFFQFDQATGLAAVLATGLVGIGFVRLTLRAGGIVGHLATGLMLIHLAVFLRTVYRDILPVVMPPDAWPGLFDETAETAANALINVMIFYSCWQSLKALKLAIPEGVRDRYSLMTAAIYPPWRFRRSRRG